MCLDGAVSQSGKKPNSAHDLRRGLQTHPNPQAKHEPDQGHDHILERVAFMVRTRDDRELPEGRKVHPHESQEGAEIQNLSGLLVGNQQRPDVCHDSNQPDVASGSVMFRVQVGEDAARKDIVPAHAKEQTPAPTWPVIPAPMQARIKMIPNA